jgi:(E)-4-hydroxy-3-methylbut-2-enyl-diphosphate synthase
MHYCNSPFLYSRRLTREMVVGDPARGGVIIGGRYPVVKQSMITADTLDTAACIQQTLDLVDVGCQLVRITAPTVRDAANLEPIVAELRRRGCLVPIVADIHFKPEAALEAVRWVEKVRINPGNYADTKKFAVKEYTDDQYTAELARIDEKFTPLVQLCQQLGRALRIGTNHGSLSDRILNRFGDSPLGMVESALEFARIARRHGYHNFGFSMKASNPKVMIECYRLLVARLDELGPDWNYPIHLGVTEAGEGEDGRVKSAIGIGSLLCDGLGDTIRVSLTEDSPNELPVCQDLIDQVPVLTLVATRTEAGPSHEPPERGLAVRSTEREVHGHYAVPVELDASHEPAPALDLDLDLDPGGESKSKSRIKSKTTRSMGITQFQEEQAASHASVADPDLVRRLAAVPASFNPFEYSRRPSCEIVLAPGIACGGAQTVRVVVPRAVRDAVVSRLSPRSDVRPEAVYEDLGAVEIDPENEFTLDSDDRLVTVKDGVRLPAIAAFRLLASRLKFLGRVNPILLKDVLGPPNPPLPSTVALVRAGTVLGSLLADGIGDAILVRGEAGAMESLRLAYNLLQAAGCRSFKTDYVACPSCGRTLFNLQTVTARIKARTEHLKGVKIAIMGCIVNGPGEMADADFGYVGGAPGKVNLYVGKKAVRFNIPEAEAVDRLVDLIREHGKWAEPFSGT